MAAQVFLRADARLGAEALAEAVAPRAPDWRSDALAARIRDAPPDGTACEIAPGLHDPRAVVAAPEAAIPLGWQMVNPPGHCSFWFAQMPSRV